MFFLKETHKTLKQFLVGFYMEIIFIIYNQKVIETRNM